MYIYVSLVHRQIPAFILFLFLISMEYRVSSSFIFRPRWLRFKYSNDMLDIRQQEFNYTKRQRQERRLRDVSALAVLSALEYANATLLRLTREEVPYGRSHLGYGRNCLHPLHLYAHDSGSRCFALKKKDFFGAKTAA